MRIRRLGWAGVEIEAEGARIVVDPLADPDAVFTPLGGTPENVEAPRLAPPRHPGEALAGLVTHLHRDHTDAGALAEALAPGAPVLRPAPGGGSGLEELGVADAEAALADAALPTRAMDAWETLTVGPFEVAALPAADGLGDPQLSWAVAAGGLKAIHCGDTLFHGWWWRMALRHGRFDVALLPINGAAVRFPHRRPASARPAVMTPEDAALAGELLGARTVIPIHYGGYRFDPFYLPVDDAVGRFLEAAAARSFDVRVLEPGEELELAAAVPA